MPKLVEMLPDTVESVIRPVVLDVTRELFKLTGISERTRIIYPGELETTYHAGSAINTEEPEPYVTGDPRISVRVDEEFDQQQALTQAVYQPEHLFVWKDERIQTFLKPSYAHVGLTINFEYRAQDKTQALRWRDEMKTRVSMLRELYLHEVQYHFALPEVYVSILQELHRMREAVDGYNEDWLTYFQANASNKLGQISTLSGDRQLWAVSETQKRVQGRFTFEDAPERGEKNAEGDTWNISFQYKFELEKPVAVVMQYPLVVHNQVVDRKFRPAKSDLVQRVEDTESSRPLSLAAYAAFEAGRWMDEQRNPTMGGRSLPDFDEFLPSSVPENSLRVFTALTTLDPQQPGYLLDFHQLSRNWSLDPGVLAYMAQIPERLTVPGAAPLVVSLYENDKLLSGRNVRVDADLKVYATRPLSLRNTYHVRLGIATGWCRLPRASLTPLRQDAETLLKLMTAVDHRVKLGPLLSTGWVPLQTLEEALEFLCRAERAKGNGQMYSFALLETLFLQVFRKE